MRWSSPKSPITLPSVAITVNKDSLTDDERRAYRGILADESPNKVINTTTSRNTPQFNRRPSLASNRLIGQLLTNPVNANTAKILISDP